jgi:hypothetical protein
MVEDPEVENGLISKLFWEVEWEKENYLFPLWRLSSPHRAASAAKVRKGL